MPKIRFQQGKIAYPGSLTQINPYEEPVKGVLLWDTKKRNSRFIHIPNKYLYLTLHFNSIEDAERYVEEHDHTTTTSFNILVKQDVTRNRKDELRIAFLKKYKSEVAVKVSTGLNSIEQVQFENKELWLNYSNVDFQNRLLTEWLKENNCGDGLIESVIQIHEYCLKNIRIPEYNNSQWKIKRLEFSNVGIYGEENYIDFTNMHGVTGIFADNFTGKSTLIEALVFAIYGKGKKKVNNSKFMNVMANKAKTFIELELNGTFYRITRDLKRGRTGNVTATVQFEKLVDGQWQEANEDTSNRSRDVISELFGDREDMLKTAISGQGQAELMLDSTESERLEALYKIANLHFFERLEEVGKEEVKKLDTEIKVIQKTSNANMFELLRNKEQIKEKSILEQELLFESNRSRMTEIEGKVLRFNQEFRSIESTVDVMELHLKFRGLTTRLEQVESEQHKYENLLKADSSVAIKLKTDLQNIVSSKNKSPKEIISALEEVRKLEVERQKTLGGKQLLEQRHQNIQRQLTILEKHDWFSTNDNCKRCSFLKDAFIAQDEAEQVIQQVVTTQKYLDGINEKLQEIGFTSKEILSVQDIANRFSLLKSNLEKYDAQIKNAKTETELITTQRSEIERVLQEHSETLKVLSENADKKRQVDALMSEKTRLVNVLERGEKDLWAAKTELASIRGQLHNIEQQVKAISDLEIQVTSFRTYIDAVSKTGLPYRIIREILPKINSEVNQILSQTQDFRIEIEAAKDKFEINIARQFGEVEGVYPIECASGAERMLASIAMRVAFSKISFLPKPSFLIIDEGFGSIDSSQIVKIESFFDRLKSYFDFLLIVSHVPQMTDIVDNVISIHKQDFSQVMYE